MEGDNPVEKPDIKSGGGINGQDECKLLRVEILRESVAGFVAGEGREKFEPWWAGNLKGVTSQRVGHTRKSGRLWVLKTFCACPPVRRVVIWTRRS